jgi:hypothetical protein
MAENAKTVLKKKKEGLKDRLKNPVFLAAAAGFGYAGYKWLGSKYNFETISLEDWRMLVDLAAYVFIGSGIYSTFGKKN